MANWTETDIVFRIKKENVEKFLNCFKDWGSNNEAASQYHISRTYILDCSYSGEGLDSLDEIIDVYMEVECAWSIYSCWIHGYIEEDKNKTMESFCKEFDIISFKASSIEYGMGFIEIFKYVQGENIYYECNDYLSEKPKLSDI